MQTFTASEVIEQQMLDVLFLLEGPAGLVEKLSHHDIGFVEDGDRRVVRGVELGHVMHATVLSAAENALMPEDDMVMTTAPIPDDFKARSRELAWMSDCYTAHLTDNSGTEGYVAYRVRLI